MWRSVVCNNSIRSQETAIFSCETDPTWVGMDLSGSEQEQVEEWYENNNEQLRLVFHDELLCNLVSLPTFRRMETVSSSETLVNI
jgi:hypothetical protein